jgi:hypothetical protein
VPDCFKSRCWVCPLAIFVGLAFGSCRPAPSAGGESERRPTDLPGPEPTGVPQPGGSSLAEERRFREEQSKREAVSLYPELGVSGTAVNREYVRRYRLYQSVNPAFFDEPDWPKRLAEMLAQDLGLDPRR